MSHGEPKRHHVVIVGSGFGGLFAARALKRADVDVTIISKVTHHLFQPLLYQVATGVLSTGEVAPATREILSRQRNVQVLLGNVTDIDLDQKLVVATTPMGLITKSYDSLIIAAGANQSYFGNEAFSEHAPGLKSIDDALELRGRIFGAFEMAELVDDPAVVEQLLTFVVVGAGPTGVEMAGQIAELSRRTLRKDFRHIDPRMARILLVDAAPTVLGGFGDRLSSYAERQLIKIGVEVKLNAAVVGVDAEGVDLRMANGEIERIESICKMWAAGVSGSPLGRLIAERSGAEIDRVGRVKVEPDCSIAGHSNVFVVGDLMALDNLPGVAQVAMQGGRHVAKLIKKRAKGKDVSADFEYWDKGSMATISRFRAVASVGRLRFSGFFAWILWLVIHLLYLIGFKNRITTLLHWVVSFFGRGRSERAGTVQQVLGRTALKRIQTDEWNLPNTKKD
jgi:NADH:ubiquinone reductase (H+-translocating)